MQMVRVGKADLMGKIVANRKVHEETYSKAMDVYRKDAIKTLRGHLKKAKAGGEIVGWLGLEEPREYLDQYDRAIAMLDMSTDEVVELNQDDFNKYVLDQWSWKGTFETTTRGYVAKFRG